MANNPIHPKQSLFSIIYGSIGGLLTDDCSPNFLLKDSCKEIIQSEGHVMAGSSGTSASLANFQNKLEDCLDDRSARGILARAGRAAFHPFLVMFGEKFGWFKPEYNLLTPRKRLKGGLELLAQNLYPRQGNPVTISNTEKAWFWRDPDCPWCSGRISDGHSCTFTNGFLQEFTYWAGSGKTFLVREVECLADGSQACIYQIDKKPIKLKTPVP